MKTKDLLKYFFGCGAVIYTVGSALILIISLLLSESASASILAPLPFLFYLGFSYVISLGNTLFRIDGIPSSIRRLIHASAYILGVFAFVLLCGMKFAYCVIVAVAFAIIYAAVVLICALIGGRIGKLSVATSSSNVGSDRRANKKHTDKKVQAKEEYKNRFS